MNIFRVLSLPPRRRDETAILAYFNGGPKDGTTIAVASWREVFTTPTTTKKGFVLQETYWRTQRKKGDAIVFDFRGYT